MSTTVGDPGGSGGSLGVAVGVVSGVTVGGSSGVGDTSGVGVGVSVGRGDVTGGFLVAGGIDCTGFSATPRVGSPIAGSTGREATADGRSTGDQLGNDRGTNGFCCPA